MSAPKPAERHRMEDFYERKWRGHSGYWEDRYPFHQRVYAVSVYRRRNAEILRSIQGPVDSALDLGCGVGDVALLLSRRCRTVTAVDVSLVNAGRARENLRRSGARRTRVVQCGAERLPFADGSFDLVVLADVMEHVPDPRGSLAEIGRVLRPGGRLVAVTPLRGAIAAFRVLDRIARRVARPLRRERLAWSNPPVFERLLSRRQMRRALVSSGFRVVGFRSICFYPAPETGGTFGGLMARLHGRVGDERFEEIADRVIGIFGRLERLRVLNQKQLWVARR